MGCMKAAAWMEKEGPMLDTTQTALLSTKLPSLFAWMSLGIHLDNRAIGLDFLLNIVAWSNGLSLQLMPVGDYPSQSLDLL